ncbi:MAG: hypothetical protein KatS3mg115_2437 [Candidatus Poribacteria bacterium]|nr:MAG: hypothetical protein KatS3mg115_2437 [Candidatus Poribacteria bacterium]
MSPRPRFRFLADMGISPFTVQQLRDQGYDALHLHEGGFERLSDEAVLEKARQEGWILLTHDLDFSQLLAQAGAKGPSVILFRLADMRPESVSRHLGLVLEQAAEDLRRGAVVSVREDQIRVRPPPIQDQEEGPGR